MKNIQIYDSTLRDGAQSEGISYSLQDKIHIANALDSLGVAYVEAGNPGSNPKDIAFFQYLKEHPLKQAKLVAFGSTRKKGILPAEDANIVSLLQADTPCVAIFGKAWDLHVTEVLKATLEENLAMIADTVAFLKANDKEVVFDAEHFFDGYKANATYAMKTLEVATEAGADVLCLCDTNGGCFPEEIKTITEMVVAKFPNVIVGIHTHDDGGMAVANSIMAVEAGATQVQGTLAGFGERCGNANLSAVLANLQMKRQMQCIPCDKLENLTATVRQIAEISNIKLNRSMPYIGKNAFTHKAGMHVDGILKSAGSFEHIQPEAVGNTRKIVMSEAAGRSLIVEKVRKFLPELQKYSQEATLILEQLKELEYQGYVFEGAESSFELMVMKLLGKYEPYFSLEKMNVFSEQTLSAGHKAASAIVKVSVGEKSEMAAAEGDGPVNAIDKALRNALGAFYPQIAQMRLIDYKVRVLDSSDATGAKVRVLIESTNGTEYWTTVGVSNDIIKASCRALLDSIEYRLMKDKKEST